MVTKFVGVVCGIEIRDETRASDEAGTTAHLRDTRRHLVVGRKSGFVWALHPRGSAASSGPRYD